MIFPSLHDLKDFLEIKYSEFNTPQYIESDPIQVPHLFSEKENVEIAAFLTSIITWGRRNMIIPKALEFMRLMGNQPYEFVLHASENEIRRIEKFQYRTFMGLDAVSFVRALRKLYQDHGGLCTVFENEYKATGDIKQTLSRFRKLFLEYDFPYRSLKHLANVDKGSAAKRLNMFLRWMVRKDDRGVDFGLWTKISPSDLMIPLDVHAGNVARKLGILSRKQSDWKAVEEVTSYLRKLDPEDPVKYDFALFGLGVFEKF